MIFNYDQHVMDLNGSVIITIYDKIFHNNTNFTHAIDELSSLLFFISIIIILTIPITATLTTTPLYHFSDELSSLDSREKERSSDLSENLLKYKRLVLSSLVSRAKEFYQDMAAVYRGEGTGYLFVYLFICLLFVCLLLGWLVVSLPLFVVGFFAYW
jgi:hypothetical protein